MKLSQLKKKLKGHEKELQSRFGVRALYVFGSVASGKATSRSDVDFIVEFSSDEIGLFEFVDLKLFLESVLKQKVDLVTRDAIHKAMIERIEQESVRVA